MAGFNRDQAGSECIALGDSRKSPVEDISGRVWRDVEIRGLAWHAPNGSEAKTYVTEYGQDMGYTNGQDMGYSFEQSRGCERTAKEHYFGVS
jgi:hypothetical protein